MLTHLSLFSGIGGLDLAAEWAGFTTFGQCEWADYPTKVLEKHWPNVPRWRDIRTLTGDSFYAKTGLRTVDVISGGFPCQPFSVAGKQKGKGDDRYLWPEMLRVIRELTPRWVVGENVPGILRIAAADVVKDMERAGYNVVVFAFEAAAVGAVHRRERVAFVGELRNVENTCHCGRIKQEVLSELTRGSKFERPGEAMAYGKGNRLQRKRPCVQQECGARSGKRKSEGRCHVRNANNTGLQNARSKSGIEAVQPIHGIKHAGWWAVEPDVGRVANGVPNRVDRLKCLGNAVVPQQFYPIFKAIAEEENSHE